MIRINCPYCHATLAPAELEQVEFHGQLGLLCPDCGSVLVRETASIMPDSDVRLDGPGVFVPLPEAAKCYLPLDAVRVSAGFPSPAADYEDKQLDINE